MTLETLGIDTLPVVEAELTYLTPMRERPRNHTYEPPAGVPRSNITPDPHRVRIHDLRPVAENATLDEQGFAVLRHHSAVGDFQSEDEIRGVYYAETQALIKHATGAARVFIFDHTARRHIPGTQDYRDGVRQPARRVHVDHTVRSGPQRVRDLVPEDAEELLKGRVQIINLWRPIKGPVLDAPLALADASSVAFEDLVPADLVYPHRTGETYAVKHNPRHRWFYLSRMQPSEAFLIKCFDSKTDGRARFAPHTAFTDPTAPADVPARESIEIRSLVFHPE
jgi:hypothetical protein